MRVRTLGLLLLLPLAGCLDAPTTVHVAVAETSLRGAGLDVPAGAALLVQGRELVGPEPTWRGLVPLATCLAAYDCPTAEARCEPAACERTDVEVLGAAPFDGRLVVGLRWPSAPEVWLSLRVEDEAGETVAVGRSITIDHNGASAVLDAPKPGRYHIVVASASGTSTYEAAVRLVPDAPPPTPPRDLLPDMVTLPPTDLRIAEPPAQYYANAVPLPTGPLSRAAGAQGCTFDEAAAGARRCLRFSNAVANLGEGSLDIALSLADGATYAAGGRFVQRVALSDGTAREHPAGPAEYHVAHGHWHNAGSNVFTVRAYDPETGTPGEPLREGRKTGMCFADVGIVDPAWPGLTLPTHQGAPCFNPALDREWSMGLAPGWYDLYGWALSDQFVDITGLEDGTYQLCSTANGEGFLAESDTTNNEGCTAFRLEGDQVETLDPLPYYAEPPT